jgi:hypothetical protein
MENSSKNNQNKDQTYYIPTKPKVFLDFIDILFAALIAYMISEIPVKGYEDQSITNLSIFFMLYSQVMIKMFLHWWGLHIEIPIGEIYLNKKAALTHYLGAIISSCVYVALSKLLISWISVPNNNYKQLESTFIVLIIFRGLDIVINLRIVPTFIKTAKKVNDLLLKKEELVLLWYKEKLPKIVLQYIVQIFLLFLALRISKTHLLTIVIFILLSDVLIEYQFCKGRNFHLLS